MTKDDDDDIQDYVRPWVGLTDEDIAFCVQATAKHGSTYELIAAIEAKLKEKNT
jgi:hypothetical protein